MKLEPCPFCGAPALPDDRQRWDYEKKCSVWDRYAACPIPGCPGHEIGGDYGSADIESWNRRPSRFTPEEKEAMERMIFSANGNTMEISQMRADAAVLKRMVEEGG